MLGPRYHKSGSGKNISRRNWNSCPTALAALILPCLLISFSALILSILILTLCLLICIIILILALLRFAIRGLRLWLRIWLGWWIRLRNRIGLWFWLWFGLRIWRWRRNHWWRRWWWNIIIVIFNRTDRRATIPIRCISIITGFSTFTNRIPTNRRYCSIHRNIRSRRNMEHGQKYSTNSCYSK